MTGQLTRELRMVTLYLLALVPMVNPIIFNTQISLSDHNLVLFIVWRPSLYTLHVINHNPDQGGSNDQTKVSSM